MIEIGSPVLVPFGRDVTIFDELQGKNVYVYPPYKFWARNLELLLNHSLTKNTMDYIRDKINDDYTGIIKRSKYYRFLKLTFNASTALFLDTLYQIDLDQKHKDILVLLLSRHIERYMDDLNGCKKIYLNLEILNEMLEDHYQCYRTPRVKNGSVKVIIGDIGVYKFVTIYDSIPRAMRMFNKNYLGFIQMFSNINEEVSYYEHVLEMVVNYNLIHGGILALKNLPIEIETKFNNLMKKYNMEELQSGVWKSPDIMVNKITKGIKKNW